MVPSTCCLGLLSLMWLTPWPKATGNRNGLFSYRSQPIIKETNAGTQERNLESETEEEAIEGWRFLASSTCFLTIRTACPWVALPTVGWAPPYHSLIEKMHPRRDHRLLWRKQFLTGGSLFPDVKNCRTYSHNRPHILAGLIPSRSLSRRQGRGAGCIRDCVCECGCTRVSVGGSRISLFNLVKQGSFSLCSYALG